MAVKNKLKNVAIRMVAAPPLYSDEPVDCPAAVIRVLGKELGNYDREVACVVNCRSDMSPINMNIVSMGTINTTVVGIREVFKSAILSNAANIMLVHNHPSGSLVPSRQDMMLTRRVRMAAEIMGIPLMDHIIIGSHGKYYSFMENGILNEENSIVSAAEKKGSIMETLEQNSRNCQQAENKQKKEHTHKQETYR